MLTPAQMLAVGGGGVKAHASPSVRHFARELGVDVTRVSGTGPKGRITQADVQAYVKGVMAGATSTGAVPPRLTLGGGLDLLVETARLDASGRLTARALLRVLGWTPGHRVDIAVTEDVLVDNRGNIFMDTLHQGVFALRCTV